MASEYSKRMSKAYDAMVDDNNVGLKKWVVENSGMFDERSLNKRADKNANFKDLLKKIKVRRGAINNK